MDVSNTPETPDTPDTPDAPDTPQSLFEKLRATLRPRKRVMVAYSGGIDSTLVAVAAQRAIGRGNVLAVLGDSASLPRHELEQARSLAEQLDLELLCVEPGEQDDTNYQANRADRCYFCKTNLYATLAPLRVELGYDWIANGTNVDDLGDHRPGLLAADQANVISPLVEAGLGKQDVRAVAKWLALPNADKPAAACLASRIAYGTPVTPQRLSQVEQAETVLRELGFTNFRVRHHEPAMARLELPPDQFSKLMHDAVRQEVIDQLKVAGYHYVTLDLQGFRSGSGNVLLTVQGQTAATS